MSNLEELLVEQRALIDALAAFWLQAGATAFGISQNGADLLSWAHQAPRGAPRMCAPIRTENCVAGDLWVEGAPGRAWAVRLEIDAAFLSRWLEFQIERDTLMRALAELQDQLVTLRAATPQREP